VWCSRYISHCKVSCYRILNCVCSSISYLQPLSWCAVYVQHTHFTTIISGHLRCIALFSRCIKLPKLQSCPEILNVACMLYPCVCWMLILQFQYCHLMSRNILPTGAALMYTLDEMSVLSMRMFFNSLTYQANKLLEKVNTLLCCTSCFESWMLVIHALQKRCCLLWLL